MKFYLSRKPEKLEIFSFACELILFIGYAELFEVLLILDKYKNLFVQLLIYGIELYKRGLYSLYHKVFSTKEREDGNFIVFVENSE